MQDENNYEKQNKSTKKESNDINYEDNNLEQQNGNEDDNRDDNLEGDEEENKQFKQQEKNRRDKDKKLKESYAKKNDEEENEVDKVSTLSDVKDKYQNAKAEIKELKEKQDYMIRNNRNPVEDITTRKGRIVDGFANVAEQFGKFVQTMESNKQYDRVMEASADAQLTKSFYEKEISYLEQQHKNISNDAENEKDEAEKAWKKYNADCVEIILKGLKTNEKQATDSKNQKANEEGEIYKKMMEEFLKAENEQNDKLKKAHKELRDKIDEKKKEKKEAKKEMKKLEREIKREDFELKQENEQKQFEEEQKKIEKEDEKIINGDDEEQKQENVGQHEELNNNEENNELKNDDNEICENKIELQQAYEDLNSDIAKKNDIIAEYGEDSEEAKECEQKIQNDRVKINEIAQKRSSLQNKQQKNMLNLSNIGNQKGSFLRPTTKSNGNGFSMQM